jgi:hypothetical protein
MRSPTWITPAIGGETAAGEFKSNQVSKDNPGHQQFVFTEEQKRQFKEDPEHHLQFRKQIEAEVNWMADVFMVGSTMQKDTQQTMIQQMKNRIGEGHDELASKLIPQWPPGCRRLTPGDRYLESLVESNVEPIFGDIQRIDHSSIVTMDGTHHEVDILVRQRCLSFLTFMELIVSRSAQQDLMFHSYPPSRLWVEMGSTWPALGKTCQMPT